MDKIFTYPALDGDEIKENVLRLHHNNDHTKFRNENVHRIAGLHRVFDEVLYMRTTEMKSKRKSKNGWMYG